MNNLVIAIFKVFFLFAKTIQIFEFFLNVVINKLVDYAS